MFCKNSINFFHNSLKYFNAKELIKKVNIPAEKFEEIATKFGLLLKIAGTENTETCTLNQFDKDNFSFNCQVVMMLIYH